MADVRQKESDLAGRPPTAGGRAAAADDPKCIMHLHFFSTSVPIVYRRSDTRSSDKGNIEGFSERGTAAPGGKAGVARQRRRLRRYMEEEEEEEEEKEEVEGKVLITCAE